MVYRCRLTGLGDNRSATSAVDSGWLPRGRVRQHVAVIDPAIESHYGTGLERSRLFPGGRPSLAFVRSMELHLIAAGTKP